MNKDIKTLKLLMYDGCNLKCNFCHNEFQGNKSGTKIKKFSFNEKRLSELYYKYNINAVKYSGGEPMLNYKELLKILRFTSEKKNIKDNIILTNLTVGTNKELKMLVRNGMSEFRVNIPSLEKNIYTSITKRDTLNAAIERCLFLSELNIKIRLHYIITDSSVQSIKSLEKYINDVASTGILCDISILISAREEGQVVIHKTISSYLSSFYPKKRSSLRTVEYFVGDLTIYLTRCSAWSQQDEIKESNIYVIPPGVELSNHTIGRAYND